MTVLITFIQKAIGQAVGMLFGATGEIITEKSGNLNLGIPGMMYMGGIAGLMGAFFYEKTAQNPNGLVGLLFCMCSSLCSFRWTDLQCTDHYPAGKPERSRSGTDNLWCRFW